MKRANGLSHVATTARERPPILCYGRPSRGRRRLIFWGILTSLVIGGAHVLISHQRQRLQTYWYLHCYLRDARSEISDQNFAEAQTSIDRAQLVIYLNPSNFSSPEIRFMRNQVDRAQTQLKNAVQEAINESRLDPRMLQIFRQRLADGNQSVECFFEGTGVIMDLTRTMRTLMAAGDFIGALQTSDQILILEPGNRDAAIVHEFIRPHLPDPISRS